MTFRIGPHGIGREFPPFVVAEMSGNHNQSLDRALKIVAAAANAGAHAIKLQTYTADTMTIETEAPGFVIKQADSLWNGRSLYDLYREAHTPWEWHGPIFEHCKELGILAFSTPFDESAVDFLESHDTPAYKVASFEITHLPLIERIARTGKPTIISTGMSTVSEIQDAVETFRKAGGKNLVLLKCTSTYPASAENTNLRTIPHLRELFGTEVGLSDHTMGVGASVAAVSLGATFIEKHFTLARSDGGVDSAFSLEPNELACLVTETKRAWQALGAVRYGPTDAEKPSLKFRRSIYIVKDVPAGEPITEKHIQAIRPGFGLPPKFWHEVIGKKAKQDLKRGTPVSWDIIG